MEDILKNVPWLAFSPLRHLERDHFARESGGSACQRSFHKFRMNGLHAFAKCQSSHGYSATIRWPSGMRGAAVNGRLGIAHSSGQWSCVRSGSITSSIWCSCQWLQRGPSPERRDDVAVRSAVRKEAQLQKEPQHRRAPVFACVCFSCCRSNQEQKFETLTKFRISSGTSAQLFMTTFTTVHLGGPLLLWEWRSLHSSPQDCGLPSLPWLVMFASLSSLKP